MSKNPFPGPQPYRAEDRARYYGRAALVKKLANQILACSATTVYGPSGAGKSSLMQAGVIPALQDANDVRVARVDAWPADQPLLLWLVNEIFIDWDLGAAPKDRPVHKALEEAIDLASRRSDRPMLIYLDQLEQIFLSDRSPEELRDFLQGLTWLSDEAKGDVHLVLSLREDYLGRFRDFTRERPALSAQSFRVPLLSVGEMVKAMCRTAGDGDPPQTWNEAEIRSLMLDVRVPGQTARDDADVQTAFGQIVCRALFEERTSGQTIDKQAVNAEAILQRYLDTAIAELGALQDVARVLLEEYLIDDEGHRRLLTEKEARLLVKNAHVMEVLDKLDAARVLRAEEHQGSRYFEIGHDWLAKKILEKRLERKELARLEKEKRRRRTLMMIVGISMGALLVMGVLVVFAWYETKEARRLQIESTNQTNAAVRSQQDAVRASRMAGVRELLANHNSLTAALVLAEIDRPESARGWRKLTMELLANGLPWRTIRFDHEYNITSWSPDRQHIVTTSKDKILRIWSADGSDKPKLVKYDMPGIPIVAWTDDGSRVALGFSDGTVRVWNADGSSSGVVLSGPKGWVLGVSWSPDGKRIAATSEDKNVYVWNADGSGKSTIFKGHGDGVWSVDWSPDGTRIATASYDRTVRIWNADGSGREMVFSGHKDSVVSVAWSPDGQYVASVSWDNRARVWRADGQGQSIVFTGHDASIRCVAWSPDSKYIATGASDGTARVWTIDKSAPSVLLAGHELSVYSIGWSADGRRIYTTSFDNTARVWNAHTIAGRTVFVGHENLVRAAAWSPDSRHFVTGSNDHKARVWNVETNDVRVLEGHKFGIDSVAWSPDGTQILTTGEDSKARIWNASTSDKPYVLEGHEKGVTHGAWSPDGKFVATTSDDKTVRIWNANGSGAAIVLSGHTGLLNDVEWSSDGKRIVTAADDKTARIWNSDGSGTSVILQGHDGAVETAKWSPDGRRILTGSLDGTARIWNADGLDKPLVFDQSDGQIFAAIWHPQGTRFLVASTDHMLRLWDVDGSNAPLVFRGHQAYPMHVEFNRGGEWFVSASLDATARIWNIRDTRESIVLQGHDDEVTSASFSPDNKRILTTSDDRTAMVWLFDFALLHEALYHATSDCLTAYERETYLLEDPDVAQRAYVDCEIRNGRGPRKTP